MILEISVWLIRIHSNSYVVTKLDMNLAGQRNGHPPLICFQVKIHSSSSIEINVVGRIIAIGVFCPVPVSRRMRGWPALCFSTIAGGWDRLLL